MLGVWFSLREVVTGLEWCVTGLFGRWMDGWGDWDGLDWTGLAFGRLGFLLTPWAGLDWADFLVNVVTLEKHIGEDFGVGFGIFPLSCVGIVLLCCNHPDLLYQQKNWKEMDVRCLRITEWIYRREKFKKRIWVGRKFLDFFWFFFFFLVSTVCIISRLYFWCSFSTRYWHIFAFLPLG